MSKTYKGYELIKKIAEGNIEDGTRFKNSKDFIYKYIKSVGTLQNEYTEVSIEDDYYISELAKETFELIEDEIDIQDIEELTLDEEYEIDPMHFGMGQLKYKPNARKMHDKINEIIKNVNQISRQLDNKINK